jgi:hypothetical protein
MDAAQDAIEFATAKVVTCPETFTAIRTLHAPMMMRHLPSRGKVIFSVLPPLIAHQT